jgi:hypothetical protein
MALPAGAPILYYSLLRAGVRGGRCSLAPLSSHSPFMVSLRMADYPFSIRPSTILPT